TQRMGCLHALSLGCSHARDKRRRVADRTFVYARRKPCGDVDELGGIGCALQLEGSSRDCALAALRNARSAPGAGATDPVSPRFALSANENLRYVRKLSARAALFGLGALFTGPGARGA